MDNLAKRSITGAVLVAVILLATATGYPGFLLLVLAINLLTLLEFYRLFFGTGWPPAKITGAALSVCLLASFGLVVLGIAGRQILLINVVPMFGIFITQLYAKAEKPFYNIAFTLLGIVCITIPLCFFTGTAFMQLAPGLYHPKLALAFFFMLWAGDTGAYFTGKYFGRHPLFLRVSPNKTRQGSFGGAACAVLTAVIISRFWTILSTVNWVCMAFIIIVFGTFGDLFKSLMKRSLNLKDAGSILPGHGGMLDRFDSLLGSAPFVFTYLTLLKHA